MFLSNNKFNNLSALESKLNLNLKLGLRIVEKIIFWLKAINQIIEFILELEWK